ncbi:unnamed protein product (macronuclear) [Paramecium tetraurelia]|uniref:C2 domain-containing protein n=1 Tax=Paramecium tetraurelia TaxID=5888 RepID=A0CXK2_PARTE|nr:uncharacterized protein GSPATT00011151001 [Paramecium tetraurelia]CAK75519.1 unnamed protein product [Paramecium tetraurelia]|eukprot:XP_001442916.1 hypothetical protein (macronuclear) [Paramecium tetraurelia strain d4-2]
MDKLQTEILLVNKDIYNQLYDTQSYTKLDQLKKMSLQPSPIHVAKDLLSARENPKDYVKQHKLDFKFRQTQFWQPSITDTISYQQSIQQQQSDQQQDKQQLVDTTNAISFIETSKNEESQMQQSSQSTRRKIMFKSRISKQPSDSSIWKKPLKQINKIVLQLMQDSKAEYFAIIKYEDASNQLEQKSIDVNKKIQWDCQVKFEITEEQNLYIIIVQQQQGKIGQQNVLQQAINIQNVEKQFQQEVQLKYLKNIINANLLVDFN